VSPAEEVLITGPAAGGDGVGRLADGRAVFVRGALPGERVAVELTEARPRFARAEVSRVVEASTTRVVPPCPRVAAGCGGCGWQHVDPPAQRELKAAIVADALRRLGGLADHPEVGFGPDLPDRAWRTTVRAAVAGGVAGFHGHHSHDVVAIGDGGCLVSHPLVDEVLRAGRFGAATEVVVRAGAATGERLVVVRPAVGDDVEVPDGTTVVGGDQLATGHRAWIHEVVAGRRWRISAGSFFQARPDGAAALAELAAAAVVDAVAVRTPGRRPRVVDLYGGVGLLGGTVADRCQAAGTGVDLQVVEANRSAVADAKANLVDLAHARLVRADVRRWRPAPADAVVADPSRHGLGADVVGRIGATGAPCVVLVSCDAGALGRDAGLLAAAGYRLDEVTLVDLFPHTPHIEVVTTWHA
jgi:23S rRNA (uracil1939-C5)-methyltransferase